MPKKRSPVSKVIEGHLSASGLRFAIVASRFNDFLVEKLVDGALDAIVRHGGSDEETTLVRVPAHLRFP